MIYISGSNDPYSIYQIKPENHLNAVNLVLHNKNHNQVRFKDLNDREEVMNKLNQWIK